MDAEKQGQGIAVQITKNFDNLDIDMPKLGKLVKSICRRFGLRSATVSIAIVSDAEIRRINNQFLGRNYSTDCLSFDLSDDGANAPKFFELVVNAQRAVKQANLHGHLCDAELALYVAHALLHQFGFDDSQQAPAREMHNTEDEILQQFGYGAVYNKNSG
jgi:probable rRNA maturation factor